MNRTETNSTTQEPNYVAFRVAGQEFCVEIMSVREIRSWTPATALPKAPPHIHGVINLRGSVVPIIDFRLRAGLEAKRPNSGNVIIIVQVETRTVGLLVDEVSEILNMNANDIKPTPNGIYEDGQKFVAGVAALDERMIRMIDLKYFSDYDSLSPI